MKGWSPHAVFTVATFVPAQGDLPGSLQTETGFGVRNLLIDMSRANDPRIRKAWAHFGIDGHGMAIDIRTTGTVTSNFRHMFCVGRAKLHRKYCLRKFTRYTKLPGHSARPSSRRSRRPRQLAPNPGVQI
jgi:hypothetical protein